jgi:hypothetical protein
MTIWGNIRDKIGGRSKILFIDTEGILNSSKNASEDCKIFSMIFLISSLLLYNSNSFIDENGILDLSVLSMLNSSISTNVILMFKKYSRKLTKMLSLLNLHPSCFIFLGTFIYRN